MEMKQMNTQKWIKLWINIKLYQLTEYLSSNNPIFPVILYRYRGRTPHSSEYVVLYVRVYENAK